MKQWKPCVENRVRAIQSLSEPFTVMAVKKKSHCGGWSNVAPTKRDINYNEKDLESGENDVKKQKKQNCHGNYKFGNLKV